MGQRKQQYGGLGGLGLEVTNSRGREAGGAGWQVGQTAAQCTGSCRWEPSHREEHGQNKA